ncbi:rRNA methyltransferase [Pseudonocardia nematodicida]|uniref:rRNA methyltransferase n=1 Tax=Pseudonocardia nematodicida TaxID=1206997 RepID=A0ABV1KFA3_9PSEU
MQYRHAPAANHAGLDAVLVSAPGRPTLPVRLTVELLGRARAHLGTDVPVTVWDPCCGAGGTLTVLGLLSPGIRALAGTDVDDEPLDLARRNLGLLSSTGPAARAAELDALAARYGKPAYVDAAAAARSLRPASAPVWTVGVADALDPVATRAALGDLAPDVVLADLPHGRQTSWAGDTATGGPERGGPVARGPLPGGPHSGSPLSDGGARGPVSGGRPASGGRVVGRPAADDPGAWIAPVAAFVRAVATVLAPDAVIVAVGRGRSVPLPPGVRARERVRAGHRSAVLIRAGDVR